MLDQITHLLTLPNAPLYNIKAVVRQTDVHISTLRAWEQRYGVPHPNRSEHGHRLYSERDVAIIKWLKQCTENGLAISQAVVMLGDTNPSPETKTPYRAEAPAAHTGWINLRHQLLDALAAVNLHQAHLIVNTAYTLFPVETVILELFQPTLVELGKRWACGEASIADERVASNFIRQRLVALIQLHAPFARGPRVFCACAPGEQHEIGLLTFALLMEQRSWEVIYLGQNISSEGLADFLAPLAPALFCVSISMVEHVNQLLEVCRALEPLQRKQIVVAYGGRVFSEYPELQQRIPGVFLGNDMLEAVRRADDLGEEIDPKRWHNVSTASYRTNGTAHLAIGVP